MLQTHQPKTLFAAGTMTPDAALDLAEVCILTGTTWHVYARGKSNGSHVKQFNGAAFVGQGQGGHLVLGHCKQGVKNGLDLGLGMTLRPFVQAFEFEDVSEIDKFLEKLGHFFSAFR